MKRPTPRKKAAPRRKAKKKSSLLQNLLIAVGVISVIAIIGYHYRDGLAYYLGYKTDKIIKEEAEQKRLSDVRNFQILSKHQGKIVGIDVSEYQGNIHWDSVKNIEGTFPIQFVILRSTAGKNRIDAKFHQNWKALRNQKIIRGAYHYYRPNENSLQQAELFIKTVKLKKGDLPPILDIEKLPKNQSLDSLKVGLKRWLKKVEEHYGEKPIIYSGESYYNDFLEEEFADYAFWIANYNFFVENIKDEWLMWQFTEKGTVSGIKGNVDVNIFNGNLQQLKFHTIGN